MSFKIPSTQTIPGFFYPTLIFWITPLRGPAQMWLTNPFGAVGCSAVLAGPLCLPMLCSAPQNSQVPLAGLWLCDTPTAALVVLFPSHPFTSASRKCPELPSIYFSLFTAPSPPAPFPASKCCPADSGSVELLMNHPALKLWSFVPLSQKFPASQGFANCSFAPAFPTECVLSQILL